MACEYKAQCFTIGHTLSYSKVAGVFFKQFNSNFSNTGWDKKGLSQLASRRKNVILKHKKMEIKKKKRIVPKQAKLNVCNVNGKT